MGFSGPYGVYHSLYDDFYWMKHFGDPTFAYHATLAQIIGTIALRLDEADILPFDYPAYAWSSSTSPRIASAAPRATKTSSARAGSRRRRTTFHFRQERLGGARSHFGRAARSRESGADQSRARVRRAGFPRSRGPRRPPVVQASDLRARNLYRLRGGRASRRNRSARPPAIRPR